MGLAATTAMFITTTRVRIIWSLVAPWAAARPVVAPPPISFVITIAADASFTVPCLIDGAAALPRAVRDPRTSANHHCDSHCLTPTRAGHAGLCRRHATADGVEDVVGDVVMLLVAVKVAVAVAVAATVAAAVAVAAHRGPTRNTLVS